MDKKIQNISQKAINDKDFSWARELEGQDFTFVDLDLSTKTYNALTKGINRLLLKSVECALETKNMKFDSASDKDKLIQSAMEEFFRYDELTLKLAFKLDVLIKIFSNKEEAIETLNNIKGLGQSSIEEIVEKMKELSIAVSRAREYRRAKNCKSSVTKDDIKRYVKNIDMENINIENIR
jgi:DNA-directed RNA polymerase alpha subunit